MDKNEIINYIELGKAKSICIDRCLVDEYPGFVRDITIMADMILKVEFNAYGYDEGGLIIKIHYDDLDSLLNAVMDYLGVNIENWMNVSKTGWYPTLEKEVDMNQSGLKLKKDLINKTLALPLGGIMYQIPDGYWKDLAGGIIPI